jgi:hypothetical protein
VHAASPVVPIGGLGGSHPEAHLSFSEDVCGLAGQNAFGRSHFEDHPDGGVYALGLALCRVDVVPVNFAGHLNEPASVDDVVGGVVDFAFL